MSGAGGNDADTWRTFTTLLHSGGGTAPDPDAMGKANQARVRVEHVVARRVDALQIRVGHDWARLNQKIAIGLGYFILLFGLTLAGSSWMMAMIIAIPGGFLAPVAKDLAGALSTIRFRRQ